MLLKDGRIKLMNQIIAGIKVLKLYAWETYFCDTIKRVRDSELVVLRKAAILGSVYNVISVSSPFIVALICFTTYIFTSKLGILTPDIAFVSISLLNILQLPLLIMPLAIISCIQGMVSIKRINDFLLLEEIEPGLVTHKYDPEDAIHISGDYTWDNERPHLKDLNVSVGHGQLVALVGHVGSGKSSFMSALLGEMQKMNGEVNINGTLAYVPQQAWIQNLTLRDNILFSKELDLSKYNRVLEACSLTADLKVLDGGDLTEIGERGINLSGGQKQRVSLGRAVYQDLDIYLLDDPLSAVDAHVAKHIFDEIIGPDGMLQSKTRLLVTNAVTFLPQVDKVIVLKDGCISEMGTFDELLTLEGAFAEYIQNYLNESNFDESNPDTDEELIDISRRLSYVRSMSDPSSDEMRKMSSQVQQRRKKKSLREKPKLQENEHERETNSLIVAETAEKGDIKPSVIKAYMVAATRSWTCLAILGMALNVGILVANNIWLSIWSNDGLKSISEASELTPLRLCIYGILGGVQTLSVLLMGTAIAFGCVCASRTLHEALLKNTVKSPMSFFDTTPLGRIMNRFSKDIDTVDAELRQNIQTWMSTFSPLIATVIILIYSQPVFLVVLIPLFFLFILLQRVYVKTARQIKRIDSIKRSPIYANFNETLNGVVSIRAYNQMKRFKKHNEELLDNSNKVWFAVFSSNRWIGIWAEIIGDIIVLMAAIFSVYLRGSIDPGTVGLTLTFAMQISGQIVYSMRMSCELETNVVSVERIKEYTEMPTEADWIVGDHRPPADWPSRGHVTFKDYSTRYRDGLDLALKQVNYTVNQGERVGIVGRTGAGKSSITLGLFRIIEAVEGSIEIDGLDISAIGLHDLRSRISIIPQDPVLFSGCLRFNIDPSGKYPDQDIWVALDQAHLGKFVKSLPGTLDFECGEDGVKLSVGQRQLVCLARALLQRSKILILDEATAAVDLETDDLIQTTIRNEFNESTVLTIAHRLNTVMDYDRIIVMDHGTVKEYDTPSNLLADRYSTLHKMAKDAGLL